MLGEARVVIALEMRHLAAEPARARKLLGFVIELELGDDQPFVVAVKLVHLPLEAAMWDDVPRLLDEGRRAHLEQLARFVDRDRVLVFETRRDVATRLDVER